MAGVGWDGRDVSGLSHEQIHRWTRDGASPEALAAARDRHLSRAEELRTAAGRLRSAQRGVTEGWIGRDADAAGARTGTLAARMERLAETVSGQARGVDGLRAALLRVQAVVGPPRPPVLPPLGAVPLLGELRALVTGAPADGFPGFRSAAAEQAAAREAYRTYLADTANAARGVATAGAGPSPAAGGAPGGPELTAGRAPGGAAARPVTAAPAPGASSVAEGGRPGTGAARVGTPVPGGRGAPVGVLQSAATSAGPAPPGDLPVGAGAVGPHGPEPNPSARGAAALLDRGPTPGLPSPSAPSAPLSSAPALSPTSTPSAAPAAPSAPAPSTPAPSTATTPGGPGGPVVPGGAGEPVAGAPARPGGLPTGPAAEGGARAVPVPAPGLAGRRERPGRRDERAGSPQGEVSGRGQTPDPGSDRPGRDAATAPAGTPPGAGAADPGAPGAPDGRSGHTDPGAAPGLGPLDAAALGAAPLGVVPGGEEQHLPARRSEYLIDPDPAGWGTDAGRRVAPPVLGESDGEVAP